jgi:hypothetical protein
MCRDNKSVVDSFIQFRHYIVISSCEGSCTSWNPWLLPGDVNFATSPSEHGNMGRQKSLLFWKRDTANIKAV